MDLIFQLLGTLNSSGHINVPTPLGPSKSDNDGFYLGTGTGNTTSGTGSDGGFDAYEPHPDTGNNYRLGEDWNSDNQVDDVEQAG